MARIYVVNFKAKKFFHAFDALDVFKVAVIVGIKDFVQYNGQVVTILSAPFLTGDKEAVHVVYSNGVHGTVALKNLEMRA
jgi:hypothetical protein